MHTDRTNKLRVGVIAAVVTQCPHSGSGAGPNGIVQEECASSNSPKFCQAKPSREGTTKVTLIPLFFFWCDRADSPREPTFLDRV